MCGHCLVDTTTVRAIYNSVQALFLGGISSVKKSIPSAALLDVPSLAVETIKAAAMRTSYKLSYVGECKSSSIHLEVKRECPVGFWNSPQDKIKSRLVEDYQYKVSISGRSGREALFRNTKSYGCPIEDHGQYCSRLLRTAVKGRVLQQTGQLQHCVLRGVHHNKEMCAGP